ncbi:MAG: phosphatase PAP2 family protein [Acidimicrobiales bacterium]
MRLTLFACSFVLVAVPFSALVVQVLAKGQLTRFDARVANWMNDWVHGRPWLVRALEVTSDFGRPLVLALIVAVGSAYVFWRGRRRLAAYLVITVSSGALVNTAIKVAVSRPRPVVDHPVGSAFGSSFPSGHSMASTLTYGALLLVLLPALPRPRRAAVVAAVAMLVVAIGTSRLLLGVHFVTDVVGGFILGSAWLLGATAVFQIWRVERGAPHVDTLAVAHEGVEPEAAPALRGELEVDTEAGG